MSGTCSTCPTDSKIFWVVFAIALVMVGVWAAWAVSQRSPMHRWRVRSKKTQ